MSDESGDEAIPYFSDGSRKEVIESETSEEDGENEVSQIIQGVMVEDPNDI